VDFVSKNIVSQNIKTTLSPDYPCDDCGEPAMTNEAGRLSCPACYLKKLGKRIKPLDHTGFYP